MRGRIHSGEIKKLFDTLIKNITVFDGSGAPAFVSDVAINGHLIARVEQHIPSPATRIIDGTDLALAPGFIDVHTHDDTNVIRFPDCVSKISQGVTTVIVGNCGISASPAQLSTQPPDPMNLLGDKHDFKYPTFKEYIHAVNNAKPSVNVAALIGHTTLRNQVMDDLQRNATEPEIEKMMQNLDLAMQQGALGLSSGLAYASAKQANISEVIALAEVIADYQGIYTTHMRTEFDEILDAMEEAFTTGKYAKVPVVISHLKCAGAGNWGRTDEILQALSTASLTQDVCCDCYPYSASSSTLDLNQVTDEIEIFITWSHSYPHHSGKLLHQIANEMKLSLLETARALQPAGAVYHCMHEKDVERVLKHQLTAIGSDGLPNDPHPHPRLWGTFPKVLGHYCREQQLFSMEEAIHKMTGLSARRYRLEGRGEIRTGAFADIVLFDPNTIQDTATYEKPISKATGIEHVFVNGHLSYSKGEVSTQRAGIFIKHKK